MENNLHIIIILYLILYTFKKQSVDFRLFGCKLCPIHERVLEFQDGVTSKNHRKKLLVRKL